MQKTEKINSIITVVPNWNPKKERYVSYHKRLNKTWKKCYDMLDDTGTLWLFSENKFYKNMLFPVILDITENLVKQKFFIRNIITWYLPNSKKQRNRFFINKYKNIIFVVKDPDKYFFNKDRIREPHIWKNVEWGKRKNHYHELGKDPGNFWLKTKDDGDGKKTAHIPLSFEETINRCILAGSKEGWIIANPFPNPKEIKSIVEKNNREYKEGLI